MTTAAVALVLGVAPAAAANAPPKTGSGLPSLAQVQSIFRLGASQPRDRTRSCAKGAKRSRVHLPGSTGNLARKAVVACEQPPRVQPITLAGLKHAETVLNALIG